MKKEIKCPLCHEKVYSSIGKGCKMCGMPLDIKMLCEPYGLQFADEHLECAQEPDTPFTLVDGSRQDESREFCSRKCRTKYNLIGDKNGI